MSLSSDSIQREAELFADHEGKLKGFGRNSPKWEKCKKKFIDEAYFHSIVPGEQNPHKPRVSWKLMAEEFPDFSKFVASQLGLPKEHKDSKYYIERIESAITNIVQVFLELELKMKNEDFNYPKGATKEKLHEVELNRYKRLTMLALTLAILNPIFKIRKGDIDGLIEDSTFANLPTDQLRQPLARKSFIKIILSEMKPVLLNIDLPDVLAEKK
jgi:hypothetical protein